MAGNSLDAGRTVTSKVIAILMAFTEGSEHSLTEIARLAGLPISTAHRLTAELILGRLLERSEGSAFRAGLPLRLIGTINGCRPSIAERGPCILEDLAAVTKRRARLGILNESTVGYLEKLPGTEPTSLFSAAATLPAHPTAMGRALLAFSPTRAVEKVIMQGLPSYTPHTVTSPDRFRRALTVTRLTGVAVTRFEHEARMCGVAMPVFGLDGEVIAAIEVAVPDLSQGLQSVVTALTIATRGLSRELAHSARYRDVIGLPEPVESPA
jgi:DNA-binding IclR family transcriptional regulator